MAKVLLIDDEATVRGGIRRFLHSQGHDVLEAQDGREAMALARGEELDLVITDINMPGADGIEVIMAFRADRPELPVIAISGGGRLSKELLLANAEVLGAVVALPKPFELPKLAESVDLALSRAKGAR